MIHSTPAGVRAVLWTALVVAGAGFPAHGQEAAPADADTRPSFEWKDHPTLRLGRSTRISARARVQLDARDSEVRGDAEGDAEVIDLARRRIGVEGVVLDVVEFQVERELRRDDPWRDVYANYRQFPAAEVQAGKFKLPFSLDANTGATNLNFVYRSLTASRLAPGRDRGVMLHGRVLKRMVRYEVGVFDRDGRNARTRNVDRVSGGRTTAVRVRVEPLAASRVPSGDLHVGVATTHSSVPEGYPALRGRTHLDASFFSPDYWVNGARRRLGAELRWRPGPFSIESEYMRVETERRGESVDDTDLSPLVATGWYVSGTWALTGERKSRGLDEPKRPLFRGGVGALELALRTESLAFQSGAGGEAPSSSPRAEIIRGNRDRADTFGVNWYLNRWIKVQGNVVRERLSDPALGPLPSQPGFWSRLLRLQLTL